MSGLMDDQSDFDLESSVDDTQAAPDFVTPPNGVYILTVKSCKTSSKMVKDEKTKEDVKKNRVNVTISVVKTLEVAEGEAGVPDGSMFGMNYQWTEQGRGYLKSFVEKVLTPEAIKGASWKQIFEALSGGVQFKARIRVKNDGQYENVNLNDIQPAPAS